MPIHDFECRNGHIFEMMVPVGTEDVICISCMAHKDIMAKKVFLRAPMAFISPDVFYDSPIDGKPVTSMAARREDLARSNCIEYDPCMKQDRLRNIKRADDALDNAIGETVDSTIAAMPVRKREKLSEELLMGADVVPERGVA